MPMKHINSETEKMCMSETRQNEECVYLGTRLSTYQKHFAMTILQKPKAHL